MSKTIRVLITDDSDLVRALIIEHLKTDPFIEVVGEASNGQEALALANEKCPDVITMDLEMPIMNGMACIDAIMHHKAIPILVVSDYVDAQRAYDALLAGAVDVIQKPTFDSDQQQLISKIKLLAGVSVMTRRKRPSQNAPAPVPTITTTKPVRFSRLFAIASSTGGPQALVEIFSRLPATFNCPILVAQHISNGFSQGMVDWLSRITPLPVHLAKAGTAIKPGHIYIAPSEHDLSVDQHYCLHLSDAASTEIYHPRCDTLLSSVADVFKQRAVGIILTGMGHDGVIGLKSIQAQQGLTIAQDEASSLIFGMNGEAVRAGVVHQIMPLDQIASCMIELGS